MGDDGWRDMPALMSDATIHAVCDALDTLRQDQQRCFAVVLHRGEPLMMGARRLEHMLRSLRRVLPEGANPLSLQTNGVLITRDILDICAKYATSLSVSLDGPRPINDQFRIGKRGEGTHDDAVRGIRSLRDHPESNALFSGVLAVINPLSSPQEVYHYLKGLGRHRSTSSTGMAITRPSLSARRRSHRQSMRNGSSKCSTCTLAIPPRRESGSSMTSSSCALAAVVSRRAADRWTSA